MGQQHIAKETTTNSTTLPTHNSQPSFHTYKGMFGSQSVAILIKQWPEQPRNNRMPLSLPNGTAML